MNFWEPGWQETLYTIAFFLFVAVVLAPFCGWTPDDDTQRTNETDGTNDDWSMNE